MAKKKKLTQKERQQKIINHIDQHIKWIANNWHGNNCSVSNINSPANWAKDFSVLQDFTDEELAQELCRRTALGKELE